MAVFRRGRASAKRREDPVLVARARWDTSVLPTVSSHGDGRAWITPEGLQFMGSATGGLHPEAATSGTIPWSSFQGFTANAQTPVVLLEANSGWFFAIEPPGTGPTRLWTKALLELGLTDRNPELTASQAKAPPPIETGVHERALMLQEAVAHETSRVATSLWRIDLPAGRRWGYGRRGPDDPGPTNALLLADGVAVVAFAEEDEGGVVAFEVRGYSVRDGRACWAASIPPPFGALRSSGGTVRVADGELLVTAYVEPRTAGPGKDLTVFAFDASTGAMRSWPGPFGSDPFALPPDGGGYLATYPGELRRLDSDGLPIWARSNALGQRVRGLSRRSGLLDTFGTPPLHRYSLLAQYGTEHGMTVLDGGTGQQRWAQSLRLAPSMVGLVHTTDGPLLLCPNAMFGEGAETAALAAETGDVLWVHAGHIGPVAGVDGIVSWRNESGHVITANAIDPSETRPPVQETAGAAWVLDGRFTTTLDGTTISGDVPDVPDCLLGPAEIARSEDRVVIRTPTALIGLALH